MTVKEVEVALSVALAEWFVERYPNTDIETTFLEELGHDDNGILLTVGDEEFMVKIEQVR